MADSLAIDTAAARRFFARSAACAEGQPLAREVERRMIERLELVRLGPKRILDAGCGIGEGLGLLSRRYPDAVPLGMDSAHALLNKARTNRSIASRARSLISGVSPQWVCADFAALPFQSNSFQLAWSNLALAWAVDPLEVFREFRRILDIGGLLMFSTYGPDTLRELRSAFSSVDARPHTLNFADMHDLGDMLAAAGFAAPVMDMEVITLTYANVDDLLRDLRSSGQVNVTQGRRRALVGRAAYRRFCKMYESLRTDGKFPATVEVIYGHAWRGAPRADVDGFNVVSPPSSRRGAQRSAKG